MARAASSLSKVMTFLGNDETIYLTFFDIFFFILSNNLFLILIRRDYMLSFDSLCSHLENRAEQRKKK